MGEEFIYESPDGGKTVYRRKLDSDDKIMLIGNYYYHYYYQYCCCYSNSILSRMITLLTNIVTIYSRFEYLSITQIVINWYYKKHIKNIF